MLQSLENWKAVKEMIAQIFKEKETHEREILNDKWTSAAFPELWSAA